MIDLLKLLGGLLVGVFRSHAAREAEMAFLRQQLVVLKRSAPARLRLRTADRLIFVWLYRLFPSVLEAAVVFKPETLVRWHRSGFRLYWRWKSRRVGRPAVPADIRDLIRRQRQALAALRARVELPLQSPPAHRRSHRLPAPASRHPANHHLPPARRRRSNQRSPTCLNRIGRIF
jgi:hypothetical protein